MSQRTDAQLTIESEVIRDETAENGNTKTRVYNILKNITDSKINNDKIVDEDDMSSNSATQVPTQQSVKAYVDAQVSGGGAVDSVNGQTGVVQVNADDVPFTPAGNIAATDVQAAIEELDSEKYTASAATESAQGLAELATQDETNTGTDDARIVTPLKLKTKVALRSAKTAAYSILDTDDQTEITFDLASDDDVTIDQMATGYMVAISNIGAGALNFVAGSGVTLLGATSLAGGVVSGAYVRFTSATEAYVMCANNVTWGQISSRPTTVNGFVITDTVSILNSQFTTVGNVGTGDDTLHTFTVPGGTLATNGQCITAYAAGTFAATANNKRLRVKWGATTIFDSGALAITAAGSWVLEIRIMRTGATTQKCCVSLATSDSTVPALASYATAAETLTSGSALSVTGEATSNNDIVEEIFKVRKEGV